jgi:RES domain-containing protein
MRVWRICREPFGADALSGRGGLFASGRWHTRGRPIVYSSESLSLAALEILVHVEKATMPSDLVQIEMEVPEDLGILRIDLHTLPKDWRANPVPAALQRLGDGWLAAGAAAVLRVPSAVIAEESNFLLNPEHADARRITVVSTAEFSFDSRLTADQARR